jgi:2-dehydropantoate 2-reductase
VTVAVLGPGAVGGALAVQLSRAGFRVIAVARPQTAAAIGRDGLRLELCGSELQANVEATDRLEEGVDLLLVTVKAPALRSALELVAQSHKVGTVVPLLNGIEHLETLSARFGPRVVAGSIGRFEAYRTSPTRIVQTTPSPFVSLGAEGDAADILRETGIDVRVDDERRVLWDKVARLAPLAAATALTQRTLGELREDPDWRATLEAAVGEACAAAAADGVSLNPDAQWEILDSMPASVTTSAARDAAAGRPTELDAIVGGVVRAATRLGVPAPTLERLLDEAEERCRPRSR